MVCFIDDHREAYGVEPICTVLPIAPSTYHRHRAGQLDPRRRWARAHRDDALHSEIQRVYNAHSHVDGLRKVWKQLCRKGFRVARCTMRRLWCMAPDPYFGGHRQPAGPVAAAGARSCL